MKNSNSDTNLIEGIEKLALVKVRKEMYPKEIRFDWENEDVIREIVAREINLMENKINEIIKVLNNLTSKEKI